MYISYLTGQGVSKCIRQSMIKPVTSVHIIYQGFIREKPNKKMERVDHETCSAQQLMELIVKGTLGAVQNLFLCVIVNYHGTNNGSCH